MAINTISLYVIPEPAANTRAVMKKRTFGSIIFKGSGKTRYVCGKCKAILAEGVDVGQIENFVLFCNKCNSYNELRNMKLSGDQSN
jgi:hypothetical protein